MRKGTLMRLGAVAAVTGLALAGCSAAPGQPSDGPAVITFAASMLGEPARGPLLIEMLNDFNAAQDEVVVTPVTVPFSSFGATMATQMGGGGGPDLIAFDHPNIFAAIDAGLVVPIDDIVDESTMLPGTKNQIVDGKRYGVSLDIGNYALIYNPELVKNVPTTFEELVAEAKAQTKNGVYGFAFRHTQAEEAGVWYDLSNYVYGFGGSWTDANGNPTINSPEVAAGLEAFKTLYDSGAIPQGTDAATYRRMFAEGKVAMMIDNGGVPTVIQGTNPNAPIAAAAAPVPSGSVGQVMAVLGINANTRNEAATKAFLKWFLEEPQQARLQGFLGGSTVATAIERTAEELEARPYIPVFDAAGATGQTFVPFGLEAETPQLRTIVVTEVLKVLQGASDVQTALNAAQQQAEALK